MADKSISELVAATAVGSLDLFVLEQGGTAKKLTGQILENWLVALADGHGGIQTVAKTGTSGLVDTYTITYADTTTSTFTVTNGKAITGITQYWAVSTSDTTVPSQWYTTRQTMTPTNKYLWSYLHIAYNDSTSTDTTKSVVGAYGDTGQAWYVWIKYSAVQPTSDADMADIPDAWIGVYSGTSATAPEHYTDYAWYQYKGAKGDTGDASEITAQSVTYLEGSSGTVVPEGSWTTTVPSVTPGNFLWTRTQITFNDGTTTTGYSVSRFGIDGTGSVSTVNSISPDGNGNVVVTAADIQTEDNTSVQSELNDMSDAISKDAISETIFVGSVVADLNSAPYGSSGFNPNTLNIPASSNSYGAVYTFKTYSWQYQIAIDTNKKMFVRQKINYANWTAWERIVTESVLDTVETGAITKATGITSGTLDSATCRKVGNIVMVSGRIFGMSSTIGNGDFFVIPSGFRPSQQIRVNGSITLDSTGTVVPVLLTIATNGAVSVSYSQSATINQVAFAGTYVI